MRSGGTRRYHVIILAGFIGLGMVAIPWGESSATLECPVGAVAHFYGESNIHPFEGVTDTVRFTVSGRVGAGGSTDTILNAAFQVPVKSLTTHNKGRDKDMYKMFETEAYPNIDVTVPSVALSRLRPDGRPDKRTSGTFNFKMTIRSMTGDINARIDDWREDDTSCTFKALFRISLQRFELEPPRPFFGALYVKDTVRVEAPVWIAKP
ncbi:MAG: hypothetical protein GF344_16800 [Chitinivibrionales bacterium]|nr:hypothetical protein [Chitinivibrionales bacterium]MBD3358349.1 hypothetical protein [Chitinivibrionales bacterium]